ncbi:hypothetical protein ACSHWB_42545 [Lentzea sp. HUAS TT2]|uniref:hypothetical protein n=1 Tax=Lentzea sp. HUAS TT2 TaxID=3447454 RepID=UPI003F6F0FD3
MDLDARQAAVAALITLAAGSDCQDRADAGRALASFVDLPEARPVLLGLALDPENTLVVQETAEALFRSTDAEALAIACAAAAAADYSQIDHVHDAFHTAVGPFTQVRATYLARCQELANDSARPADVRAGAATLVASLNEMR